MSNSKQIVYLSQAQYAELIANGAITVDGVTVTYDENDIYVTPQAEPVTDVRINGTSIAANGVANIPLATATTAGAIIVGDGLQKGSTKLLTNPASAAQIKAGIKPYEPIVPSTQHISTFYGLAKAAGHDEDSSTEPLGTYTPEAKGAIQSMLGTNTMLAPDENDLTADKAYAAGEVFTANGKLYKATVAIPVDGAIITDGDDANCEETSVAEAFVKTTDYATDRTPGIVKVGFGLFTITDPRSSYYQMVCIKKGNDDEYKNGNSSYTPVVASTEHQATFYGLAKAAGADEKDSTLPVGQYTDTAKSAIRSMIGATSDNVIAVQDTQPTDADTKIWLPETAPEGIEVPTMDDMNAALAGKVGDVQVNGTSITTNGIANIPMIGYDHLGVAKLDQYSTYGIGMREDGNLQVVGANDAQLKASNSERRPVMPTNQHKSVFYGLAKAAGDTSQSASSNAVGTYTDEAKLAIQTMLGIDLSSIAAEVEIPLVETITDTDVTINGQPNFRYNCGEVSTIAINPPAAGSIDVIFTSGTSAAILTLPATVKMPAWFDATALETETIYEILITDGTYGSVMTWPV